MAMKLKTRKRPDREDKPLKEATKISNKVLDDATMLVLHHMLRQKHFDTLDYPVSQGKEAMVFRATRGQGYAAVKVFKYETSSFHQMEKYVEGDPRFTREAHGHRDLVNIWSRKEYANLQMCEEKGVTAPRPIACEKNVVAMEFLGVKGVASALLKDVVLKDPEKTLETILENIYKTYSAGLVHADLSEFNIIIHKGEPYFIDWGQAVLHAHPLAEEFFLKDVTNILKFFSKIGVHRDLKETLLRLKAGKR